MSRTDADLADAGFTRVDIPDSKARQVGHAIRDMLAGYPYLGSLASSDMVRYHPVLTDKFQWAATDGVNVLLNAKEDGFFAMSPDEQVFALAHETLHRVRGDVYEAYVMASQGYVSVPRSPIAVDGTLDWREEVFQQACDAIINAALIEDNIGTPPAGIVTNAAITWSTPFGEAYAIMWRENQGGGGKSQQPQPGQPPKSGSGAGKGKGDPDVLQPGEGGDPDSDGVDGDSPAAKSPSDAAASLAQDKGKMEVAVRRAQNAARQVGQKSSCVEEMIRAAREPNVDWRQYIPGFLSRTAGNSAYDFNRPMRKPLLFAEPYFVPSRGGHGVEWVVEVIDTSGSISIPEIQTFMGATAGMLGELRPKRFTIIFCDSQIQRIDDDVDIDQDFSTYPVPKGGGTSFIPPFAWVKAQGEQPDGLIYLTDLAGPAPDSAPAYPVLWGCITDDKGPWGETVHIPVADLNR